MPKTRWPFLLVLLCLWWIAACDPTPAPTPQSATSLPAPTAQLSPAAQLSPTAQLSPMAVAALRAPRVSIQGWQWLPTNAGGLLRVYVLNEGLLPVRLPELMVNGQTVSAQLATGAVRWSQVSPNPLPARDMAAWEIELAETPSELTLDLPQNASPAATLQVSLEPSPLALSYLAVSGDGERLLAFVRNDSTDALIHLDEALLDGAAVPAEIKQSDLAPGEVALVIIDPPVRPSLLGHACVLVRGHLHDGGPVTAWGSVRPRESRFPIGTWPDASTLDDAALQALHEQGFNALVVELPTALGDPLWTKLRDEDRFDLLAIPQFPPDAAQLAAFADDPSILALYLKDASARAQSATELAAAEQAYRQGAKHLTYLLLADGQLGTQAAAIPDVAGLALDAIDARGNAWTESHALEEVYSRSAAWRERAMPAPVWPWVQGPGATTGREDGGTAWNELPTPAEMRAQLYLQLAAGAKGLFWSPFASSLAVQAPEQWAEIGAQNAVLAATGDLLLYGEPAALAQTDSAKLLARPIVSEHAIIVPVVNLDYTWERPVSAEGGSPAVASLPYVWRPQVGVTIRALLPAWLQPQDAFLVSPSGLAELDWSQEARVLTCRLDLQDVALIVVADDPELRYEIAARLSGNS